MLASSRQHIDDVQKALAFFTKYLDWAAKRHDDDKINELEWFYEGFVTAFKNTGWWDHHRKITRHHLAQADGVHDDVNLLDVLEYIADCVMAGLARSGSVYDVKLDDEVLQRAFKNTVKLLKQQVRIAAVVC
ncbi:MAG: hypothetical protein LBK76_09995 [Verrucomicrobiales bacterium]|nr:hypothetical protein [Verrucomicrobiales bacterium]